MLIQLLQKMKIENSLNGSRQYVKPAAKVIGISARQVLCQSFGNEPFTIYEKSYYEWD